MDKNLPKPLPIMRNHWFLIPITAMHQKN